MVLSTFITNKIIIESLCKLATKGVLLRSHKICSLFLTLITLEVKCCVVSSYRCMIVLREAKSLICCPCVLSCSQDSFFFSSPLKVSKEYYYKVRIKQGKTVFNNWQRIIPNLNESLQTKKKSTNIPIEKGVQGCE